jgi:hypothetical protein
MVEQATCAAALHCTAAEVRAQRLSGADFLLRGCARAWDGALEVAGSGHAPSALAVAALLDEAALPELQRWIGEWWDYCHPAALRAHAALVRREGARRRRLRELSTEAARVGRGEPAGTSVRGIAGCYRDEL